MTITLLDLLGEKGANAIVQGMADRRLVHLPGGCAIAPDDLFSVEDLEALLLQEGLKSVRVTVNGVSVDLNLMGVIRHGRLQPLALRKLTKQGASIILLDIERHLPRLWALACDAERRLQDRVKIGAISSFSKLPALRAHYDEWDLILIQIEGSKLWRLFGECVDCGTPNHPGVTVPSEVSATVMMKPGDVLFVPAGLHHQCESDGFSLHVGIMVEHATMKELLHDLFDRHPSLNRPLRTALGREPLAEQFDALGEEIVAALDEMDPVGWLADWNSARGRVTRLDLRGDPGPVNDQGMASLAITMIPNGNEGGKWKVGGAEFEPGPGARAAVEELRARPRRVEDLLGTIARDVGPDEARAGLDLLIQKGIVLVDPGAVADEA
ncbi:MAG: JmjC domain-containing protein [Allosphingosinicella sp.]